MCENMSVGSDLDFGLFGLIWIETTFQILLLRLEFIRKHQVLRLDYSLRN